MCDLEVLKNLVDEHLDSDKEERCWEIKISPLEGRGIFATRNIQVGEVILKDVPLITGPRAGISSKLHCIICMKLSNLRACSKGCGLPLCSSECEQNLNHLKECEFIVNRGGNFSEICLELFRSLTPIRALLLEERQQQLLYSLAQHVHSKHGFEVVLIKSKINISEEEENALKKICYVFDANAFETVVGVAESADDFSLRGLFPISALLNHSCVPNVTHLFDKNQRMLFKSTVFIPKDAELLTSYTSLLWATAARRHHLYTTKHFYCQCQRCKDPKEFESCLSGLKCTNPNICEGVLFPVDPMDMNSKWMCDLCGLKISRRGISIIQSTLGSMLSSINTANPNELVVLLKERIHHVVPVNNHIVAELKSRVVWMFGRIKTNGWDGKKSV